MTRASTSPHFGHRLADTDIYDVHLESALHLKSTNADKKSFHCDSITTSMVLLWGFEIHKSHDRCYRYSLFLIWYPMSHIHIYRSGAVMHFIPNRHPENSFGKSRVKTLLEYKE